MAIQFVGGRSGSTTATLMPIPLTGLTGGIDTQARAGDVVVVLCFLPNGTATTVGVKPEYGFTRADYRKGQDNSNEELAAAVEIKKLTVAESEVVAAGTSSSFYRAGYVVHVWRGIKKTPFAVSGVSHSNYQINPPAVAIPAGGFAIVGGASPARDSVGTPPSGVSNIINEIPTVYSSSNGVLCSAFHNGTFDAGPWGSSTTQSNATAVSFALSFEAAGEDRIGEAGLAGAGAFTATAHRGVTTGAVLSAKGAFRAVSPRPGVEWEALGQGGLAVAKPEYAASIGVAEGGGWIARGTFTTAPTIYKSDWIDNAAGVPFETILPYNATDFERDVERVGARVDAQPAPIERLWNPDTCPPQFLPWLAWAMSVDSWDMRWTDATKREVIRNSVMVHRKKGTLGAIKLALRSAGMPVEIREWWEESGVPHTFRLLVDVQSLMDRGIKFTAELVDQVKGIVDPVKPLRSHYAIFGYYGVEAEFYIGAISALGARLRTQPYVPTKLNGVWTLSPVSVGVWRAVIGLRPKSLIEEEV